MNLKYRGETEGSYRNVLRSLVGVGDVRTAARWFESLPEQPEHPVKLLRIPTGRKHLCQLGPIAHSHMFIQWMLGGVELSGGLQVRLRLCPSKAVVSIRSCFSRTG